MNTITWIFLGIMAAIGAAAAAIVMFGQPKRTEAEQALDDEEQITEITEWTERKEAARKAKNDAR